MMTVMNVIAEWIDRFLWRHGKTRRARAGAISIEALLVIVIFTVITFSFFFLAQAALVAYFGDGKRYLESPFF